MALTLLTNSKKSNDHFGLDIYTPDYGIIDWDAYRHREKCLYFYPEYVGKYLVAAYSSGFKPIHSIINYELDLSGFGNRFRLIGRFSVLEPIW